MEISGLPVHALAVHAAVVFGPLAALGAVLYAVVPRWRWGLRWPSLGLSLTAVGSGVLAWVSGGSYLDAHPELRQLEAVRTHETRADVLIWVLVVFGVLAVVASFVLGGVRDTDETRPPGRPGWLTVVVALLLLLAAGALLVLVVLTGDAGARAVWG